MIQEWLSKSCYGKIIVYMYQTTRLVLGVLAREWSQIGVPNVHMNNYLVTILVTQVKAVPYSKC